MFVGSIEVVFCNGPVDEKGIRIAHASKLQTFELFGFEALPKDKFGTPTANIHNESTLLVISERVCHAQVDQARLFSPVNDVNRSAKERLGGLCKRVTVSRLAQSIRAYNFDF